MRRTTGKRHGSVVGVIAAMIEVKAEFGGDNYLLPAGAQGFAKQGFIAERSVGFRRVEEGDALVHGIPDKGDGFLCGKIRRIALRQSHASVADG